jgi:hypothetical protein
MAELSDLACFTFIPNPIFLLPEKGLEKVETYSHAGKDKGNPKPGFSGDSHLGFCLQVVAKSDAHENDGQGYKHNS